MVSIVFAAIQSVIATSDDPELAFKQFTLTCKLPCYKINKQGLSIIQSDVVTKASII